MNDQQLENKVRDDTTRVKKDLNTLVGDSAVRLGRLEDQVNQATDKAKADVTAWVGTNVSQMSEGIGKITNDAKVAVVGAAATVKKDVGHGLSQYNAKAQEVADKVPGDLGKQAAKYPWVAMSIAMIVGFVLGVLISPPSAAHKVIPA